MSAKPPSEDWKSPGQGHGGGAGTPSPRAPAKKKKQKRPPAKAGQSGEIGGPKGPEPTRYGDWERKGRCVDF